MLIFPNYFFKSLRYGIEDIFNMQQICSCSGFLGQVNQVLQHIGKLSLKLCYLSIFIHIGHVRAWECLLVPQDLSELLIQAHDLLSLQVSLHRIDKGGNLEIHTLESFFNEFSSNDVKSNFILILFFVLLKL